MSEYVLEGTIKEVAHDIFGVALQFIPDMRFVSRRKEMNGELTFVALQPKDKTYAGLLLAYTNAIKITVRNPKHVYHIGKVRFELDDSINSNVSRLNECEMEFSPTGSALAPTGNALAPKSFLIIRVVES